jgi:tetratricopeptide (TPR) repeat protein
MGIADYLNKQDWDGVIAECTKIIDNHTKTTTGTNAPVATTTQPSYEAYRNRGYARCFVPSKENNYQEAINDLIMAITLASDDKQRFECYVKRAYAYWIGGNYDSAIADCKEVIEFPKPFSTDIIVKIFAIAGKGLETAIIARSITSSNDPADYNKLVNEAEDFEKKAGDIEKEAKEVATKIKNTAIKLNDIAQKIETAADEVKKAATTFKQASEEAQKATDENTQDADKAKQIINSLKDASDKFKNATEELKNAACKVCNIVPYLPFAYELLGNIYSTLDYPCEALEQYRNALSVTPGSFGNPSLLDKYRETREKLNRRR